MNRVLKRLALAVVTLAVGFGTPAIAAGTASAAVTSVIYNYASGWNNPTVCVTTRGRIPGCPALVRE
jgi:hypothetical protein